MIKPRKGTWPDPADTPLDRARAIARELHKALTRYNPQHAAHLARRVAELGEPWLTPLPATYELDTPYSPKNLSEHLGGVPTEGTIRQWRTRGWIPDRRDDRGHPVNTPRDVLVRQAELRQARADRARKRRPA